MAENKPHLIITVGRQYGSGGKTIARMLAERFSCKFFDYELLNLAAKESGFDEAFFHQNDEKRGLLRHFFHTHFPAVSDNDFWDNKFSQDGLFKIQSDVIRSLARKSDCVFVGRCADYVLRDFQNVFNIFISAPMESRIRAVIGRHKCDMKTARQMIESREKARNTYYSYYTGKRWGDASSYDLLVNSLPLGVEGTTDFVAEFIRRALENRENTGCL